LTRFAVLAGPAGDKSLSAEPDAVSFLMDADRHLKAIGLAGVANLAKKTHVDGVIGVTDFAATATFRSSSISRVTAKFGSAIAHNAD
jgi:hypothetical protein